jgi:glycosyltransferase involved in cell wall biosynthesis
VNIACVIHSLDGGGAERVMASLASQLALRGHQVTLITLDDGRHDRHSVDSSVQRTYLNVMSESVRWWQRLNRTRIRVASLRNAIAGLSPEVVLAFCDRTNILTLLATKGLRVPVVISERSDPEQQSLGTAWEWLRRRTYRQAAAVVALTESSAHYLRERTSAAVHVIPSAVNPPPYYSDRYAAGDAKRILAVGRLEHEKGLDRLLTAFAELPASCHDWTLRILGEGSQRRALTGQLVALGLSDRVEMPGWVPSVWPELAAATFFVLPSRYEGFPSALMEAMAMGVPSLAVDCESGPRAVIRDESWGLLVPDEVAEIRAGMLRLMIDVKYRESLGEAGKQVAQAFSWPAMTDRYEALLKRVAR